MKDTLSKNLGIVNALNVRLSYKGHKAASIQLAYADTNSVIYVDRNGRIYIYQLA